MKPKSNPFLAVLRSASAAFSIALSVAALSPQFAQAATHTWTGGASADWVTGGNWSTAIPTFADIAQWNSLSTSNLSIALASPQSVLGLKVVDPTGAVTLSGSTLTVGTAGIDMSAATQNLTISSGLTIGAGNQVWNVASGRTLTLNTGTFTRSAGATLNIQGAGTVASSMTGLTTGGGSTPLQSGSSIFGPWLTVGTGTSTRYAVNVGGSIVGYTAATAASTAGSAWGGIGSGGTGTINYDITINGTPGLTGLNRNVNTLRYSGTGLTQNGNTNTTLLNANGILNAGTGTFTIGGSGTAFSIAPSSTHELVLSAANAGITIGPVAIIVNNGATAGAVTVVGPNAVTFSSANTFTGNLNVNGTLSAGLGLADPAGAASQGSALGNIGTAVARTITINNGGTLSLTTGNTLGTGGSTNTLSAVTTVVNSGGIFQTGSQTGSGGFWNKIGAVNLNNGTIRVGTGANNGAFQGLSLIGTVTVGGSAVSTIENFAGSTLGSNGIHLGQNATASQSITFNVADVTGNANADLTVAPALLNTSATLTASGLTKSGAGTILLTGANTYTGATVISGGVLQIGNGNAATLGAGNYAGAISGSGTLAFNSTAAQSLSGGITGGTILTKDGSGALTISGTSALGAVTLTTGTLNVNGTTTAGNTSVAGSTTLGAKLTAAGTSVLTLGSNSLTFGTSNLAVDFSALNPTAAVISLPTGLLTLNGTVTPTFSNISGLVNGNYTLIDYGTLAGAGSFSGSPISLGARSSGTVSNDSLNTNIVLSVSTDKPVWTGVNGSDWVEYAVSTATTGTPNFALLNALTATDFWTADDVQFNDTYNLGAGNVAVTNGNVTISTGGAVNPNGVTANSVTFNNSAVDYTISGTGGITAGSVVKNGTAKVTLNTSNSYTGGTTINAGTIAINTATSLGAASGALTLNNGTLQTTADITTTRNITLGSANSTILTDSGTTYTTSGALSGSGILNKTGAGTLTLSGANTYTGGTAINAGVVSIAADNNLGASSAAVTLDGGTLRTTAGITNTHAVTIGAGGGTINVTTIGQYFFNTANTLLGSGPLTVTGNGTLTANTSNLRIGQTNTYSGAITLNSGGIFEYGVTGAVGAGATFDIGNQGELALQGSPATSLANAITVSGGTNSVLSFENGTTGNYTGSLTLNANAIVGLRDWYNNATVRGGTISGIVSGAGGLTVNSGSGSGGVLTLASANTYLGGTSISQSVVALGNDAGLGTGAFSIAGSSGIRSSSATARFISNAFTSVSGSGVVLTLGSAGTGNLSFTDTGTTSLGSNASRTFQVDNAQTSFAGDFSGENSQITKTGTGVLILGGTNSSFSGGVNINAGTVSVASIGNSAANSALGTGGTVNIGASAVAGTLAYTGAGETSDKVINLAGTTGGATIDQSGTGLLKFTGNLTATGVGAKTLTLQGSTAGSGEIEGSIVNGSGTTAVTKAGTSTWTLSGTNTYTGATSVNGGTLVINGANSGAGTNVTLTGTVALTLGNTNALGSASLISLSGGTSVGTLTYATDGGDTAYQLGMSSGATYNIVLDRATAGADVTHNLDTVASGGGLGSGTVNLTAGANVSGTATASFAKFNLGGGGGGTTLIAPAAGTVVTIGSVTKSNNNVSQILGLGGVTTGNEITGAISNGAAVGANNISLVKSNTSTWTLSGTNTYTGTTSINGGKLVVNGSIASTTTTVASSATLAGNGTLAGTTTVQDGGIHAAGNSIGKQSFTNLTYADGSIFEWELGAGQLDSDTAGVRGTDWDAVNVSGSLAGLDGADLNTTSDAVFRVVLSGSQTFADTFWNNDHQWTDIFKASDGGSALDFSTIFGGGFAYYNADIGSIGNGNNSGRFFTINGSTLSWSAVPEPSTALAGLLLAGGLLRRRRVG